MNFEINKVYTIKIGSGEELVAKVKEVTEIDVVLHDPLSVAPGPNGVGLIPSLFTADPKGETRLNKSSIAIYALTDESVKSKYDQATSSVILPEKKLILG